MNREATAKQMKTLKAKGKAASKVARDAKGDKKELSHKRQVAKAFRAGQKRLARKLRATAPRNVAKPAEEAKA